MSADFSLADLHHHHTRSRSDRIGGTTTPRRSDSDWGEMLLWSTQTLQETKQVAIGSASEAIKCLKVTKEACKRFLRTIPDPAGNHLEALRAGVGETHSFTHCLRARVVTHRLHLQYSGEGNLSSGVLCV